MAGNSTNGVPQVQALTQNGVLTVPVPLTNLPSNSALVACDVPQAGGAQPITVAASKFQIASAAVALIANQQTSTTHAATSNTTSGSVITEALTTAAGADYTFTLTNSLLVAGAPAPQVEMHDGTNTAGAVVVKSITNAVGSTVIVFTNSGTAAWNGTKLITFHT